jgi:hypothetical protein
LLSYYPLQEESSNNTHDRDEAAGLETRCRAGKDGRVVACLAGVGLDTGSDADGAVAVTVAVYWLTGCGCSKGHGACGNNRLADNRCIFGSIDGLGRRLVVVNGRRRLGVVLAFGNGDLGKSDDLGLVHLGRDGRVVLAVGAVARWLVGDSWGRSRLGVVALCAGNGDGDGLGSLTAAVVANLGGNVPSVCRRVVGLAGRWDGRGGGWAVGHGESSGLGGVTSLTYVDVSSSVGRGDGGLGDRRLVVVVICGL